MTPPAGLFTGMIPMLVTPFREDGSLDRDSMASLVEFMAKLGVRAVALLGVMGEADHLDEEERARVLSSAVEASAGRLAVIVGTSHRDQAAAERLSRKAASSGAHAILSAPAGDGREPEVRDFYRRLAGEVGLPLCVHDYPAATGVQLPVETLLRVVEEVPAVAAIKVEAVPSPEKISALARGMKGRKASLLGGLGGIYSLFELEQGAGGFMTGFSFPEVLNRLLGLKKSGEGEKAFDLYRRFLPLMVYEYQGGIAVRKTLTRLRGLIACDRTRAPAARLDPDAEDRLRHLAQRTLGKPISGNATLMDEP